ncbi:hypothetical protein AB9K41_07925 [Cribrihabitans sp. XS_ASV171]
MIATALSSYFKSRSAARSARESAREVANISATASIDNTAKTVLVQTVTAERAKWRAEMRDQTERLAAILRTHERGGPEVDWVQFDRLRTGIRLRLNPTGRTPGPTEGDILHPRPPLVLATNGTASRLVETHTGLDWRPASQDEEALKALLDNVALVAADDIKRATSRLLGTDPKVWIEAVRAVSASFVDERTGDWTTPELPFVDGFVFPRKAVTDAVEALKSGKRLVFVEGDPVSGKSSALRAIAGHLNTGDDFAMLTLDADSGIDLFGTLSDILSSRISWPITPHEAREWVQLLSRTGGPPLVVAVDDFDGARGSFRQDLEALTSPLFGEPEHAATFVAVAKDSESLPLMIRIDAALTQLAHFSGDASETAAELLKEVVRPAVVALLKRRGEADAG